MEVPSAFYQGIYDKTVEKIKKLLEELNWLDWEEIVNGEWDRETKIVVTVSIMTHYND